jgi:hypothetical protein
MVYRVAIVPGPDPLLAVRVQLGTYTLKCPDNTAEARFHAAVKRLRSAHMGFKYVTRMCAELRKEMLELPGKSATCF